MSFDDVVVGLRQHQQHLLLPAIEFEVVATSSPVVAPIENGGQLEQPIDQSEVLLQDSLETALLDLGSFEEVCVCALIAEVFGVVVQWNDDRVDEFRRISIQLVETANCGLEPVVEIAYSGETFFCIGFESHQVSAGHLSTAVPPDDVEFVVVDDVLQGHVVVFVELLPETQDLSIGTDDVSGVPELHVSTAPRQFHCAVVD